MRKKTMEEYIETISSLEERDGRAQTGRIASEMNVRPSSATEMLQKLQGEGLLRYETYSGATLTPTGKKLARDLERKHSVIADFLEIIGVEKSVADADACQIEHHVSRESTEQLEKFVEFVKCSLHDPKWMDNFKKFCETGELVSCNLCGEDSHGMDYSNSGSAFRRRN
jgi:Mn-dependent DtxR family transcriptional regulator